MHQLSDKRIVALHVHSQRLGYAAFEGPSNLLGYGIKSFRGGVNSVKVPFGVKIARLLDEWQPDAIVLQCLGSGGLALKQSTIREYAEALHVPLQLVGRETAPDALPHTSNKHERAQLLCSLFPELAERLPRKRKAWQSEHYQMEIFDAVTLGVIYFDESAKTQAGRQ